MMLIKLIKSTKRGSELNFKKLITTNLNKGNAQKFELEKEKKIQQFDTPCLHPLLNLLTK